MRYEHLIRATKSDCYPTQVICLDCDYHWEASPGIIQSETARLDGWVAIGFSGAAGVYGKEVVVIGTTKEEFWDALFRRLRRGGAVHVYSERASMVWGLLDLWQMVASRQIDLCGTDERDVKDRKGRRNGSSRMRAVLEDPPFIIEFRAKPLAGSVKVVDLANYGPQPSPENRSAECRVRRTADFFLGMVDALKLHGLGSLKDTAGSQAAYSFRRRHLTHLMQVHTNERVLGLEGDSYYGGRCEAFRLGGVRGPVHHLDVSSMYPFCAKEHAVPVALCGYIGDLPAGDQPQLGAGCGLIADVLVETDEPDYPYRDVRNHVTIWPVGVFRTTLAGPELQDALRQDRVLRWYRAAWYHMEPALRSYSQRVLDMRGEYADNDDLKTWSKALGVCLIGKFGQKDKRWVDAPTNVFHEPWGSFWHRKENGEWQRFRSISNYTQTEITSSWCCDAMPAVASWVCSTARMRLLTMVRCASWEETYYCDTDALMVSSRGYSNLERAGFVRDGEPGFLRVKSVSNYVEIHGVKSYDEEGRSVRAGRPLSSAGLGTGGPRYWAKRPAAVAVKEGGAPATVRVSIGHDRIGKYRHGEVCADGTVVPFQLNEG